jgi:spore coat polysaccharide biosynthesis protein SpsF
MQKRKRISLIVQARYGSTRLPGKVLEPIAGFSALEHNLKRCLSIRNIDDVCCAIPEGIENDLIAAEAKKIGAKVIRGPEQDVLARYHKAATSLNSDIIVRVTSDCPFIDPDVVAQTIDLFLKSGADFACNNAPPSWPHGFDCEVTSIEWLERAHHEAILPHDREHVMPFIRTHPDIKLVNLPCPHLGWNKHRWTLDYPEDLLFFRAVSSHLTAPLSASTDDLMAILKEAPELNLINQTHHEKSRQ